MSSPNRSRYRTPPSIPEGTFTPENSPPPIPIGGSTPIHSPVYPDVSSLPDKFFNFKEEVEQKTHDLLNQVKPQQASDAQLQRSMLQSPSVTFAEPTQALVPLGGGQPLPTIPSSGSRGIFPKIRGPLLIPSRYILTTTAPPSNFSSTNATAYGGPSIANVSNVKSKTRKVESVPGNFDEYYNLPPSQFAMLPSPTRRRLTPKAIQFRPGRLKRIKKIPPGLSRSYPVYPDPNLDEYTEQDTIQQFLEEYTEDEEAEKSELLNQISQTEINRTLSQMEISDLRNRLRDIKKERIGVLKVVIAYLLEGMKLNYEIELRTMLYNQELGDYNILLTALDQAEKSEGIQKHQVLLEAMKNQSAHYTQLKQELEMALTELYMKSRVLSATMEEAQAKDVVNKAPKIAKLYFHVKEANKVIRIEVKDLKLQQTDLEMELGQQRMESNDYGMKLAEENLELNVIKNRFLVMQDALEQYKASQQREPQEITGQPFSNIMDVLKNYLHAESNRKSLAYQKKWLLFLLCNCQKRKDPSSMQDQHLLFKYANEGLNIRGLWRSTGYAIVAIIRMQYLVHIRTRFHKYEVRILKEHLAKLNS